MAGGSLGTLPGQLSADSFPAQSVCGAGSPDWTRMLSPRSRAARFLCALIRRDAIGGSEASRGTVRACLSGLSRDSTNLSCCSAKDWTTSRRWFCSGEFPPSTGIRVGATVTRMRVVQEACAEKERARSRALSRHCPRGGTRSGPRPRRRPSPRAASSRISALPSEHLSGPDPARFRPAKWRDPDRSGGASFPLARDPRTDRAGRRALACRRARPAPARRVRREGTRRRAGAEEHRGRNPLPQFLEGRPPESSAGSWCPKAGARPAAP